MLLPRWLFILVAVWVTGFGLFRLYMAIKRLRSPGEDDRPNFQKRGLYAMSPRTHILFAVVYLLLGAALWAMSFGWQIRLGSEPAAEQGVDSAPAADDSPAGN